MRVIHVLPAARRFTRTSGDYWVPRLKRGMAPENVMGERDGRPTPHPSRTLGGAVCIREHGKAQRLGDGPGAAGGDARDPHLRLDQKLISSENLLVQRDRGALDLLRGGDD